MPLTEGTISDARRWSIEVAMWFCRLWIWCYLIVYMFLTRDATSQGAVRPACIYISQTCIEPEKDDTSETRLASFLL